MPTRTSWGFDTKKIDTTVRPQDDFYNYALGTWLKSAKIPANESRWGSFNMLRHKTDEQLHTLLKELEAKKKVAPGSAEQIIRDMFRSGMDMERRNALGTKPLEPLLLASSGRHLLRRRCDNRVRRSDPYTKTLKCGVVN